jgi:hypothetical protein
MGVQEYLKNWFNNFWRCETDYSWEFKNISRIGSTIFEGVKYCHKNQFHNFYGPLGPFQFFDVNIK